MKWIVKHYKQKKDWKLVDKIKMTVVKIRGKLWPLIREQQRSVGCGVSPHLKYAKNLRKTNELFRNDVWFWPTGGTRHTVTAVLWPPILKNELYLKKPDISSL